MSLVFNIIGFSINELQNPVTGVAQSTAIIPFIEQEVLATLSAELSDVEKYAELIQYIINPRNYDLITDFYHNNHQNIAFMRAPLTAIYIAKFRTLEVLAKSLKYPDPKFFALLISHVLKMTCPLPYEEILKKEMEVKNSEQRLKIAAQLAKQRNLIKNIDILIRFIILSVVLSAAVLSYFNESDNTAGTLYPENTCPIPNPFLVKENCQARAKSSPDKLILTLIGILGVPIGRVLEFLTVYLQSNLQQWKDKLNTKIKILPSVTMQHQITIPDELSPLFEKYCNLDVKEIDNEKFSQNTVFEKNILIDSNFTEINPQDGDLPSTFIANIMSIVKEKNALNTKAALPIQFWYRRIRDENKALNLIEDKENSTLAQSIRSRRATY